VPKGRGDIIRDVSAVFFVLAFEKCIKKNRCISFCINIEYLYRKERQDVILYLLIKTIYACLYGYVKCFEESCIKMEKGIDWKIIM